METARQALCATLGGDRAEWSSLAAADWRALPAMAQADGVLPLLAWRLEQQGWPETMPADLKSALRLAYYSAVAQSSLIHAELGRVLAALAPITTVVVLKGAALGPTLYPAAALRPLSDIDLLVPEQDLAAATAALQALGYAEMPELTPGINQLVEYHSRLQGGPRGSVTVELHWRLVAGAADWRSPAHDWFWQQIELWQSESDTPTVWQLTPAAHLLYLAAHLVLQHGAGQARLIWLYDLHLLVTRHGEHISWPATIAQAQHFHWTDALHTALRAAHDYFGTPLPKDLLSALEASTSDPEPAAFARRKAGAAPTATIGEWLKLQSLEPRARLQFIGSLLCPSPEYIRWRYQPRASLWPLCYPYHWLRIALAGLEIAGHLIRQPRKPIGE
ncbi:MAG TPA: nucleotidyltransferase family protein [Herpetosiphonaceae bacterium]